jgi:hypothetical protein
MISTLRWEMEGVKREGKIPKNIVIWQGNKNPRKLKEDDANKKRAKRSKKRN